MHIILTLAGLFSSAILHSSQPVASGWYGSAPSISPAFSSPNEACAWFIGNKCCTDWIFTHVSNGGSTANRATYHCYGIWIRNPVKPWHISTVQYIGPIEEIQGNDENYYNDNVPISDELKELIQKTMQRFYGEQFNQWNINAKMLKVFQKWINKVSNICSAFTFMPAPVMSPMLSASAVAIYLLKYGFRIVTESESQANYSCMLSAAAGMKTEFWEAGNL